MPNPETDIVQSRIAVPGPNGGTVTAGDFSDVLTRLATLEALTGVSSGIASGYYYGPRTTIGGDVANYYIAANTLFAVPFDCPAAASFNQIRVNVTAAAGAGGTIRFGIYSAGADGLPANLIVGLGTIDVTAIGQRPSAAISLTRPRGLCWIVGAPNQLVQVVSIFDKFRALVGFNGTGGPISCVTRALTPGFSSLPATFGTPAAFSSVPAFELRAA